MPSGGNQIQNTKSGTTRLRREHTHSTTHLPAPRGVKLRPPSGPLPWPGRTYSRPPTGVSPAHLFPCPIQADLSPPSRTQRCGHGQPTVPNSGNDTLGTAFFLGAQYAEGGPQQPVSRGRRLTFGLPFSGLPTPQGDSTSTPQRGTHTHLVATRDTKYTFTPTNAPSLPNILPEARLRDHITHSGGGC
jgi:hypothetical protein